MTIFSDVTVLADGCFDPLHIGHIRYLHAAKSLGDQMVIRVAPDSAIVDKGRVPFQAQHERMHTISALNVGYVCGIESLAEAVRKFKPAYLAKGSDWQGRLPADVLAACEEVGTHVVYTSTQDRTSSERLSP